MANKGQLSTCMIESYENSKLSNRAKKKLIAQKLAQQKQLLTKIQVEKELQSIVNRTLNQGKNCSSIVPVHSKKRLLKQRTYNYNKGNYYCNEYSLAVCFDRAKSYKPKKVKVRSIKTTVNADGKKTILVKTISQSMRECITRKTIDRALRCY